MQKCRLLIIIAYTFGFLPFICTSILQYGSLHIMRELEKNGHTFDSVVICGGLTKSRLFLQSHADILQLPVLVPHCAEPVLLGAAISAAAATPSKTLDLTRVVSMSGGAELISPNRNVFA